MHIAQVQHLKPLQDTKPFTVRQAKLLKFLTKSFGLIILCVSASTLLCSVPASGDTHITTLSPSKEQPRIVKLLNYFVQRHHYRKVKLNDDLATHIFDRYLESLDPNRSFLYATDVEKFSHLRSRLDDQLRRAQLASIFSLFNIYRSRVEERVAYALNLLANQFNFDIDERYQFDRRDAAWITSTVAMDKLWRQKVKNDYLSLKTSGKTSDEITKTLRDRYRQIQRRVHQFTNQDVLAIFANAYLTSVDPHSRYLSPRARDNFKIRMSLSLEGIGAVLRSDSDYTRVLRVVPGGAADIAGDLKAGDRIISVGQAEDEPMVDVIGWRLDDVVALIRGPKDTLVRLELIPTGKGPDANSKIIRITRDKIKLEEQAAKTSIIEIKQLEQSVRIGVIQIPTFYIDFEGRSRGDSDYRSTTRDTLKLLDELQSSNIDGLIIDLRGNGGGALTEAISLSGLFISAGPIIQIRDDRGRIRPRNDPDNGIAYNGPLAVLVDRESASASEIFAGAIQDYRRGLIIGEPTFGKGTVQNLIDLDRYSEDDSPVGHLKITTAQFFRIDGSSTQHRGIVPDIVLPTTVDSAIQGERGLDHALPWARITPAKFQYFGDSRVVNELLPTQAAHEARLAIHPSLLFLQRTAALDRRSGKRKSVSLLESARRNEKQRLDAERQSLFADLPKTDPTHEQNTDASSLEVNDTIQTIILNETARILADALFGFMTADATTGIVSDETRATGNAELRITQ